ncbi:hypothetical protein BG57_17480 [Caballeronia grimmiae]|uniref:Uncharacterized protein n=1 Tax=Caballeronia grimmiae TaxID=1071679 RepID=A0A069P7J0_9BURK|nr:hypothetical protein BG57_17480 [Caballeronia grimmiae]
MRPSRWRERPSLQRFHRRCRSLRTANRMRPMPWPRRPERQRAGSIGAGCRCSGEPGCRPCFATRVG